MSNASPKKRNIAIALPVTGEEEWRATRESIESGWLTQGPKVAEFEKQFAAMHKVKHALAVTSCTTGLHLALAAMDVGPGDEVIVPAFTWVATPEEPSDGRHGWQSYVKVIDESEASFS